MNHRVVVTGVGAISAVGENSEQTWQAMLAGKSGIAPITLFDASNFNVKIQAEVKVDPIELLKTNDRIATKQLKHINRSVSFALLSALEALDDSHLEIHEDNADEIGVIFGSGAGGSETFLKGQEILETKGAKRISPFLVANFIVDAASGHIAIATGARGPNMGISSACATGTTAIGEAFCTIARGDASAIITGSSDAVLLPIFHATWTSMRALSKRDLEPSQSMRPFDLERDGFIAGEGGAAFILESYEHALARKAKIYAEIIGYGSANDAHDMISLDVTGRGLRRAIEASFRTSDVSPDAVDYINPHGSATQMNDLIETNVFKKIFGNEKAYRIPISSVKPIIGHCMGGTGSLEALACILAIRDQKVPPTINYQNPDPECDLDYVPNNSRSCDIGIALSTSAGLGGHNATLLFKRI